MSSGTMLDTSDYDAPAAYQFRDTVEYDHGDCGDHVVDAVLLGVNGDGHGVYYAKMYRHRYFDGHYHKTTTKGEPTIVLADKQGTIIDATPAADLDADSRAEYIRQTGWYDLTDEGLVQLANHADLGIDGYPEFYEMGRYGKSRRDCLPFATTKFQLVGVLANGVGVYYKPYSNNVRTYTYDVDGEFQPVKRYRADLDEYATIDSYFDRMDADEDKPGVKDRQPVPHPE